MTNTLQKRPFFFYGWVIVAISFVTLAFGYGSRYSFSVFYVAILDEFNWPRGTTATIVSFNSIVYALSAPLAGALMDKYGPRKVFPLGGALIGLGLIACYTADAIWHFYIYFGVIAGMGLSFLGTTPHNPILANWFNRGRGLAMGLAFAGIGCGYLLGMLAQSFISHFGWRLSYIITGLMLMVIVIPLTAIFQRSRPEDKGLFPDGERFRTAPEASHSENSPAKDSQVVDNRWASIEWTLQKAAKTRRFWTLCVCNFVGGIGAMSIITHQIRFAVDMGFSEMLAASAFGIYGIANVAGHAAGFVSDRLGRELANTLAMALCISAIFALLQVNDPSQLWMLYFYSILFGLGIGLFALTVFAGLADVFQGKHLGAITGLVTTSLGIGFAIGPWLSGYIYDLSGSYNLAFIIAMISMAISCTLFWIASPGKVRRVTGRVKRG